MDENQIGEMYVRIEARTAALDQQIARIKSTLPNELSEAGSKAKENLTRELTDAANKAGNALTLGLTAPIIALGKASFDSAVGFERMRLGMTAIMGDARKANAEIENLRKSAREPGLGFEEAVKASLNLQGIGKSAKDARTEIEAIAKANARIGGNKENFAEIMRQWGQIQSLGKVTAENINIIAERLPGFRKVMAETFGTANTEIIQKAIEGGKITMDQFIKGMTIGMSRLPKISDSVGNDIDNLKDDVKQAMTELGNSLLPIAKDVIPLLTSAVKEGVKWWKDLGKEGQENAVKIVAFTAAAGPALKIITGIGSGIKAYTALKETVIAFWAAKTAAMAAAETQALKTAAAQASAAGGPGATGKAAMIGGVLRGGVTLAAGAALGYAALKGDEFVRSSEAANKTKNDESQARDAQRLAAIKAVTLPSKNPLDDFIQQYSALTKENWSNQLRLIQESEFKRAKELLRQSEYLLVDPAASIPGGTRSPRTSSKETLGPFLTLQEREFLKNLEDIRKAMSGNPSAKENVNHQSEGKGKIPASIRSNNPGAMWFGSLAKRFGAIGVEKLNDGLGQGNNIALFENPIQGAAAQFALLAEKYTGKTLESAIRKWSGGNNVESYLKFIQTKTGIGKNQVLTKDMLFGESGLNLVQAMAHHEAGKRYPMDKEGWKLAQAIGKRGSLEGMSIDELRATISEDEEAKKERRRRILAEKERMEDSMRGINAYNWGKKADEIRAKGGRTNDEVAMRYYGKMFDQLSDKANRNITEGMALPLADQRLKEKMANAKEFVKSWIENINQLREKAKATEESNQAMIYGLKIRLAKEKELSNVEIASIEIANSKRFWSESQKKDYLETAEAIDKQVAAEKRAMEYRKRMSEFWDNLSKKVKEYKEVESRGTEEYIRAIREMNDRRSRAFGGNMDQLTGPTALAFAGGNQAHVTPEKIKQAKEYLTELRKIEEMEMFRNGFQEIANSIVLPIRESFGELVRGDFPQFIRSWDSMLNQALSSYRNKFIDQLIQTQLNRGLDGLMRQIFGSAFSGSVSASVGAGGTSPSGSTATHTSSKMSAAPTININISAPNGQVSGETLDQIALATQRGLSEAYKSLG